MQYIVLGFRPRRTEPNEVGRHAEIAEHSAIRGNNSMSAVVSYREMEKAMPTPVIVAPK
jgi:hypothetical protein